MENITNETGMYRKDIWKFNDLFGTAMVCLCIAVLNLVCMVILLKSKKLQKSGFHFLTLCLSIGDFLTMIFTVVLLTNASLEDVGVNMGYLCSITSSFVYCSILFSLCQTLFICIERFLATSTTNNTCRNLLSQKKCVPLVFGLCVMYTIIVNSIDGFNVQYGCIGNKYSFTYMVFKEVPLVSLLIVIFVIYTITAIRIKQLLTKVSVISSTRMSRVRSRGRVIRLKLNLFTLGLILIVLCISIVPRVLVALTGKPQSGNYGNITLLVPPIFNPLIYFLRFVEFRNIMKQKCACCSRNDELLEDRPTPFNISSQIPINDETSKNTDQGAPTIFQKDYSFSNSPGFLINEGTSIDKEQETVSTLA